MNRVEYILNLGLPEKVIDDVGLVNAYVFCLKPAEACALLMQCALPRVDLRNAALRKVCFDIERAFEICHAETIAGLLNAFAQADSKGSQSLGYCLGSIAACAPQNERLKIQRAFILSKYKGARKRAYAPASI